MDEDEVEVMPAAGAASAAEAKPEALPEDGVLAGKWKDLAAMYASQPRLANALSNANLSFREEDGRKVVSFTVTNEAQKKWIEERILCDLEGKFARLTDCGRIRLEPSVVAEKGAAHGRNALPRGGQSDADPEQLRDGMACRQQI